jgi:hypothetical protein
MTLFGTGILDQRDIPGPKGLWKVYGQENETIKHIDWLMYTGLTRVQNVILKIVNAKDKNFEVEYQFKREMVIMLISMISYILEIKKATLTG